MLKLTAVFEQQDDSSWIAWVEELPGANTQGDTLVEAKENLKEAIELIFAAYREDAERELRSRVTGHQIVREDVCFA